MINLDQLRTFYYIASYRSLSDAASFLKMDKSSASRQLRSLESFLKRPLIIRSSQGLSLTSFGYYLLEKIRPILFELKTIQETFLEDQNEIKGIFRLTSTHALISTWITHFLDQFIEVHPKLQFEIIGSNAPLDLQAGEFDAAIRPYMENEPFLIQIPLMRWRLSLFATSEYINRFGMPRKIEDLDQHRFIIFEDNLIKFPLTYNSLPLHVGIKNGLPRKPFIKVNSVPGMYNLINRHLGIGCLSKDSLNFKSFKFVPILPDLISTEVDVYYIYPENYQCIKKVHLFGEFLKEKAKNLLSTLH